MKKILVLIPAFLLAFQISKAQTEKGSQTLGIDVQFTHQKTSQDRSLPGFDSYAYDFKATNFSIGPTYSYFIADKLDIGISANYGYYKQDSNDNNYATNQSSHQYGASLFLRKYFMFGDKLGLRAGPYLGYTRYDFRSNANGSFIKTKNDSYNVGANMALVYYPAKKLGVAATLANLSYNHTKIKDDAGLHGSSDNVFFNLVNDGLAISVFYTFGGK
ncbi:autotransporter outer membrane beta-barrel domain-containing protein [Mucilaginibacter angelicae]|uniref:Autotransporter outer membrane beta-barrel domain-containing protein n=1 Tax=Mucilaginibacter angelicae TaxID=869718 RepID=A0ABV6KYY7_9SPHI